MANANASEGQGGAHISDYQAIISDATGVSDPTVLRDLEEIMRHDIFHSALDRQSRAQLKRGAKEALKIHAVLSEEASVH